MRVFVTTDQATYRIYTLMHDPQCRLAMAWQNVGYNQPPHPSFYIGGGMSPPSSPDIQLVKTGSDRLLWNWKWWRILLKKVD